MARQQINDQVLQRHADEPEGTPSPVMQVWWWLWSPRPTRPWITVAALLLLGFAALVHLDLVLRTVRSQLPLSLALLFNLVVFTAAIVAIAFRAGQVGWLLGAGACLGAATAWLSTELFVGLSFMDPEGSSWPGNGLLHMLTVHVVNTGNLTFVAELLYLQLWVGTTELPAKVRWAVRIASLILFVGFIVVLALGGGAGERYGGTG